MLETVPRADVRLLYYADFWDYPCSGALLWRGRRYWFNEVEWDTGVFDIIELSDQVWAVEDARHADFRRFVGSHTDFDETGAEVGQEHPSAQHSRYYDTWLHDPEPDPHSGRVVARWRFDDASWLVVEGSDA
ncbi:MAG TPA: hypothetical protein VKG45_14255 [Actinomycetes bacterium]|nr:hypothetical protein [Actinomycetes bacterium]